MDKKSFIKMETWGVPVNFGLCLLLCFSYTLSGGAVWSVLFGAVNASVWEYIKTLALPYVIWAAMETAVCRTPLRRMIVSKAAGLYAMTAAAVIFYNLIAGPAGYSSPFLLALGGVLSLALGQLLSFKVLTGSADLGAWFTVAAFALVLFAAMYLTFTINPPKMGMFCDPNTGIYGIPPKAVDAGDYFLSKTLT